MKMTYVEAGYKVAYNTGLEVNWAVWDMQQHCLIHIK